MQKRHHAKQRQLCRPLRHQLREPRLGARHYSSLTLEEDEDEEALQMEKRTNQWIHRWKGLFRGTWLITKNLLSHVNATLYAALLIGWSIHLSVANYEEQGTYGNWLCSRTWSFLLNADLAND